MKEKKVLDTVEMNVEEAVDLHDRSWLKEDSGMYVNNLFTYNYSFAPFNLSRLISSFDYKEKEAECYVGSRNEGKYFYTSGDIYIVRKNNDRIEIKLIHGIRDDYWNKKTPRKILSYGPHSAKNVKIFELLSQRDHLNLEEKAPLFEKSFFIPGDGKGTLAEISALPLWDDLKDYEIFLNAVYGKEQVQEKLKNGERFDILHGAKEISNKWIFVIACLSPKRYTMCYNAPLSLLNNPPIGNFSDYILKGEIGHSERWSNLYMSLLHDYADPKRLGNGVIVMSEDRIPKYLKRYLCL